MRDVVRDVVAGMAPDELVVVDGLAQFDDDTVVRRLARSGEHSEPLGFGADEIVVLVTPVVWLVLDEAAKQAAESAVGGARKVAKALVTRFRRGGSAPAVVPPLSREQLIEVRRAVEDTARWRGLAPEQATAIADALVARLALTPALNAAASSEETDPTSEGGTATDGAATED